MNINIFNAILTATIGDLVNEQDISPKKPYHDRLTESYDAKKKNKFAQLYRSEDRRNSSESIEKIRDFMNKRAPAIVKEIIMRLELSKSKAHGMYLAKKKLDELLADKSRVKKELIHFDKHFYSFIGRYPTEKERQPMKLCYLYYSRLKAAIQNFKKNEEVNKNKDSWGLKERLAKLNAKKNELQKFLVDYESEFHENYGRRIMYQKDLNPVEREYKEYKSIKEEIKEIERKMH